MLDVFEQIIAAKQKINPTRNGNENLRKKFEEH